MNIKISIKDCDGVPIPFYSFSFQKWIKKKEQCFMPLHKKTIKNVPKQKTRKKTAVGKAANRKKSIEILKSIDNQKDKC